MQSTAPSGISGGGPGAPRSRWTAFRLPFLERLRLLGEIRKIREEHSARFGHDLDRIVRHLKKREKESGRRYPGYFTIP